MKTKEIFKSLLIAALVAVVFGCEKDEKSSPTISWSNPADIKYGMALSAEQLNATASVEGTFSYTPRIGTVLEAGAEQELTVNFTPEDKGSYKEVSASVLINVLPGEPKIIWENPVDIVYETALSETEFNASANTAGTFVYTPELGTVLKAGNEQELMVMFTPEDTDNYQAISKTVVINVLKQDPVITWEQPMDMFYYMNDPEPLTEKQLNATANIEGNMNYVGLMSGATVLLPGKRELQVQFVPTDTDNYNTVTKSHTVLVSESAGIVTDVDGNKYHSVQIGEQVWMAENLKTTKLNDGTELVFSEFTETTPSYDYTFYYDDERCKDAVGATYDWKAVDSEKLCPLGWHIPSDEEWKVLTEYLVNNGYCGALEYNTEGLPNINKAISSSTWLQLETMDDYAPGSLDYQELINKSGFTAVPTLAHTEIIDGDRIMVEHTDWWSSTPWTQKHSTNITREIYGWSGYLKERVTDSIGKSSVRCVKD